MEEDEEYVVEKVLDKRISPNGIKTEYLLKWKGFGFEDCTWEPSENMNCDDLMEAYEKERKAIYETKKKRRECFNKEKSDASTTTTNFEKKTIKRKYVATDFEKEIIDPWKIYKCYIPECSSSRTFSSKQKLSSHVFCSHQRKAE